MEVSTDHRALDSNPREMTVNPEHTDSLLGDAQTQYCYSNLGTVDSWCPGNKTKVLAVCHKVSKRITIYISPLISATS